MHRFSRLSHCDAPFAKHDFSFEFHGIGLHRSLHLRLLLVALFAIGVDLRRVDLPKLRSGVDLRRVDLPKLRSNERINCIFVGGMYFIHVHLSCRGGIEEVLRVFRRLKVTVIVVVVTAQARICRLQVAQEVGRFIVSLGVIMWRRAPGIQAS